MTKKRHGRVPLCLDECDECDSVRLQPGKISMTELATMKNHRDEYVDWRIYPVTSVLKVSMICDDCNIRQPPQIFRNNLAAKTQWCFHCVHLRLCDDQTCLVCKGHRLSDMSQFYTRYNPDTVTTLNGTPVDVRMLTKGCITKLLLECLLCGVFVITTPNNLTKSDRSGLCPCLKRKHRSGVGTIPTEASCASEPFMVRMWSDENELPPEKVVILALRKIIWHCPDCNNKWRRSPRDIAMSLCVGLKQTFCMCCVEGKFVCGRSKNECLKCWSRSFASNAASKFFDLEKNHPLKPWHFGNKADQKVWFKCPKKHSFQKDCASVNGVVFCPDCQSGNNHYWETQFFKYLSKCYGGNSVRREHTIEGCVGKKGHPARFDGVLFGKIILEVDGEQHYKRDVPYWGITVEYMKKYDRYKDRCAMQAGFGVIRISQRDIKFDRNNWRENTHMLIDLLLKQDHHRHVFRCYEGKITWEEHVFELEF